MTKNEASLRAYYFAQVHNILMASGATILSQSAPSDKRKNTDYIIMTDGGKLDVHLYDDCVMTRFDRPAFGRIAARDANPHSGKWNFHTFIGQIKTPTKEWMDAEIALFADALKRVNARPMKYSHSTISMAEFHTIGIESLRDRIAFGDRITIEDFDQADAASKVAAYVTDVNGDRPEWIVTSARKGILNSNEVEAYHKYLNYLEYFEELDPKFCRDDFVAGRSSEHARASDGQNQPQYSAP